MDPKETVKTILLGIAAFICVFMMISSDVNAATEVHYATEVHSATKVHYATESSFRKII